MRAYLSAAAAVVQRDFQIYISYRFRFASQLFQVAFTATLFYYVSRLVTVGSFDSPDDYYAFVLIGLMAIQILAATMVGLPTTIRQELVAGTFERVVLSPMGATGGIVAMTIFPFLSALALAVCMAVFAGVAFGLPVEWDTAALALPVAALGALAFTPFALLMAAGTLAIKQTAAGSNMIIALLSLVGGFYFPVTLLPDWLEWTSDAQPFTPALDLIRHLVVGAPLADPALLELGRMAGFALLLLPISIVALNAAVAFSRRRGTIIEY